MPTKSSTALFEEVSYDKNSPFLGKIVECYCLNKRESTKEISHKETWHISLDISGSGIEYRPGDSIGICPENDLQEVLRGFSGLDEVQDEKNGRAYTFQEYLLKKVNLIQPTKKFLRELVLQGADDIAPLLEQDKRDQCRTFLQSHTVFELLKQCPQARFEPQSLIQLLSPLLPRLYSISSSQKKVQDQVHLTISKIKYEVAEKKRIGVCSDFLCQRAQVGMPEVSLYLQKTRDFVLPECHHTPIIMIGPGTGVAPYRAFMQEREAHGVHMHKNWLFFGGRYKAHDFFYEAYWSELQAKGALRLDTAFSRDQKHKVYVQHKMWEERRDLFKWLEDGATLYVCGDATYMAKDVDAMLQKIVSDALQVSLDDARAYISSLRKQKRYLRDIY